MVAVQTQYAASLAVSVAARTHGVKPGWELKALQPGGRLIKAWSVRRTLHAHVAEDHDMILSCLGPALFVGYREWFARHFGHDNVEPLLERVLDALGERPLTREELHEVVPEFRGRSGVGWGLDAMGLAFRRQLCVVGQGANQQFARLPPPRDPSHELADVLRRYLEAYGPATRHDFAHWTGMRMSAVRQAFERLDGSLTAVHVEGLKGVRYVYGGLEIGGEKLGVKMLAKFDPLVLAHKDKGLFLANQDRDKVFRKAGQVEAVVLSEGQAVATWRMAKKSKRAGIAVEPFRPLGKREVRRLEREAERMCKALGAGEPDLNFV
jgi:hypothetical protein